MTDREKEIRKRWKEAEGKTCWAVQIDYQNIPELLAEIDRLREENAGCEALIAHLKEENEQLRKLMDESVTEFCEKVIKIRKEWCSYYRKLGLYIHLK